MTDRPEVAEGIRQITMPMPLPLKHVHAYTVETDDGWVLVDAGFPSRDAQAAMQDGLESLGGPKALAAIIISHFHPDHCGLAGWLQQPTDVPVYVHEADAERVAMMLDPDPEAMRRRFAASSGQGPPEMPVNNGFSRIREEMQGLDLPIPRITGAQGGEVLEIGGRRFELVWTPGHTPGHLCVLEQEQDLLFTGDHMLNRITPHIGLWPGEERNPLAEFEESLRLVARMNPARALPAHEATIEQPAERVDALLDHHQERRRDMLEALEGGARTSMDVTLKVFAHRDDGGQQRYMANSETLAHLQALIAEGKVRREGEGFEAEYVLV